MADHQKILKLIEQAAKEGWTNLDLSGKDLTSFPPEITTLTNLTSLDLSDNQLTSLPSGIAKLTNLTSLNLGDNQLTSLSPGIAKLTKLTSLDLSVNQLTSLPPRIAKLTNLTRLDLGGNNLASLPSEIIQLKNLVDLDLSENELTRWPLEITHLKNLSSLALTANHLTSLPVEISELIKLEELHLSENQLKNLPPEIAKLTNLTALILWSNELTGLPPEIAKLANLRELDLWDNQLTNLPVEITELINLTTLDLGNNQLVSLPPDIAKLTQLTIIDLRNNQLPIPPEPLAKPSDVKAILAAIAAIGGLTTGERLNEAKMLVVGDGKVGKSSVVEQLIHGTFNLQKQTTLGVDINDEMKVVHSQMQGEGDPVKLNIWDFGGQEIEHSTHQFFLTTRSLYLLVVDARKGDQISNIEYWLKLIESFGGDAPIIIVINQIDQLQGQRPLNLDRKALQGKYNIRDFVETSCETGEGIQALKTTIAHAIEQLKHVRDIWPREWIAIKQRLKEMQDDYIPVEKYVEVCREKKLNDEDLQQSLLDILHVLGTIVRFPGDTQVLNPRWVTQGVYGLLTSKQLVDRQGQFDLKDVGTILAGLPDAKVHYPSHTHERLIKVMRHFELCFEFTDRPGHYLIPRHLHDNEPDTKWEDSDALKFQYHYETLPDSVISRFIVRMNQYIAESNYWKNGVFLVSGNGEKNVAKIKADMVDRRIFISVAGKDQTRRAFLAVIRSAFDEINSNFKIEIEQKIPVPGFPQVLVSYKDLLAYEEMNEGQIFIPELRRRFSVRELLDGVEDLTVRIERRENESRDKRRIKEPEAAQTKPQPRILRVVVASPGDVQPERNALPSVIDEVNHGVAADRGLHLVLTRWETDAYPGFHSEGTQGLIDPILNITDSDILIGIFWKSFGTPTSDGQTGTEHEFNLAYEAWQEKGTPQIFVYFNQTACNPKSKAEAEQWGQVLDFQSRFPKEGLWWRYKGKADFEKQVRNHLTNYIRTLT